MHVGSWGGGYTQSGTKTGVVEIIFAKKHVLQSRKRYPCTILLGSRRGVPQQNTKFYKESVIGG